MDKYLRISDRKIKLSNPEKLLWPELGITKYDYIKSLAYLAPYMLKYTKNRYLSSIRYPDGYNKDFFYQKNTPKYAPSYINTSKYKKLSFINLDSVETLIWLGTLATLEYHISFNQMSHDDKPTSIVFDLDPYEDQEFSEVIEIALLIYNELLDLGIDSYVKTSGSKGLQIFIPVGSKYSYNQARSISTFFAKYLSSKYPKLITIERFKKKRNNKLYFDYLQMWHGKSIIAPYSPRANRHACISTPLKWEELNNSIHPSDYTLQNIVARLDDVGDLFEELLLNKNQQDLDFILDNI